MIADNLDCSSDLVMQTTPQMSQEQDIESC